MTHFGLLAGSAGGGRPGTGLEIAYERLGEGPSLVFVHGTATDGRLWEPRLGALAAIMGYSEGGTPASLFAATYPERCEALVLLETAGVVEPPDPARDRRWS